MSKLGLKIFVIFILVALGGLILTSIFINYRFDYYFENYLRNIRKNKVGEKVIPVRGDAREVIDEYLVGKSDRVLMPLPEFARDFIESAFKTVKPEGGIIHFYDYGEEPEVFGPSFEFIKNLDIDRSVELKDKAIVRSYAPNLYHVVLDLLVK